MSVLPAEFVEQMHRLLGAEECASLCSALDDVPPVSIRLNPAKCCMMVSEGRQTVGVAVSSGMPTVPWSRYGVYLRERPQFTLDTDFHAGAYYVQEAGSQFVEYLLRRENVAGKRILDMCAAPGGKTTIYSTLAGREGIVVANEYVRNRAGILADNVRKWGAGNTVVTCCDTHSVASFEGWFDVVAVDAPCSGEGMFRKDIAARGEWSPDNVQMCAARQMTILRDAWQSLRAGGLLIYSTCTFNDVENEGVLRRLIEEFGDEIVAAEVDEVDKEWGIVCSEVGEFKTFRFFPHRTVSEGFFAAVARKAYDVSGGSHTPKPRRHVMDDVPTGSRRELSRWIEPSVQMRFAAVGDTIYGYAPERYDDVRLLAESLPVIYSGVAMGQIFKGALKPDRALSHYVALNRSAVACAALSREEALEYLRKHDVPAERFAEGINLVECDGAALGFLKRIGLRCNNMYPNSLRIMNV